LTSFGASLGIGWEVGLSAAPPDSIYDKIAERNASRLSLSSTTKKKKNKQQFCSIIKCINLMFVYGFFCYLVLMNTMVSMYIVLVLNVLVLKLPNHKNLSNKKVRFTFCVIQWDMFFLIVYW
jgi:hypothetical protein